MFTECEGFNRFYEKKRNASMAQIKKVFNFYYLQEVHCTKENECLWMSEWGYRAIFSNLTSSRAGVCILFNNNFSFEITKQFSDPGGRFIIADIKTEQKTITLANVYVRQTVMIQVFL